MATPTDHPPPLRRRTGWLRRPHTILGVAGVVLVTVSSLVGSGGNLIIIPFLLWMLLPWAVLWLSGRLFEDDWIPCGAAVFGLAFEAGIRSAVFLFPQGSTAAVALVFSPALVLIGAMPVGGVLGWLAGKAWRWSLTGRIAVILFVPPVLGLGWLALARPELFPIAVVRREAALTRIGPPRIVAGADIFGRTIVSTKSLWPGVGDLDGRPGEELVLATHAHADFLDPVTLTHAGTADYAGLPPTTWSWHSRLVRVDGQISIAQTGGGYSETKLLNLDGATRWHYRPNPALAPDALRPADLDGDGVIEFYSSYDQAVVRLDGSGREIWRRPTRNASLTALASRGGESPGWVLAVEYGRKAVIWDEQGRLIAEVPVGEKNAPMAIVEHARGRTLVSGGPVVRGTDLKGKLLFEIPLPDMNLSTIHSLRFASGSAPHLAVIATADRHTKRWRALIVAPDGRVIYDEVSDNWLNWLVVRKADGSAELFLTRPNLIERLRPRAS